MSHPPTCSPGHTDTPPACWVEESQKRTLCTQRAPLYPLLRCLDAAGYGWMVMATKRKRREPSAMHSLRVTLSLRSTHLFDPLQQREQPVLIHLAVTVQEGQDSRFCHVCPSDSGADQTCPGTHHVSCCPDSWVTSPASSSRVSCTRASPGF